MWLIYHQIFRSSTAERHREGTTHMVLVLTRPNISTMEEVQGSITMLTLLQVILQDTDINKDLLLLEDRSISP